MDRLSDEDYDDFSSESLEIYEHKEHKNKVDDMVDPEIIKKKKKKYGKMIF